MTDPHEEVRAFCRAVLAAFPGAKITKHPLSRTAAKLNGLPLPKEEQWPARSTKSS